MKKLIFVMLSVLLLSGCSRAMTPRVYSRTEMLMGTFVQIKIDMPERSSERGRVKKTVDTAFDEARRLDEKFNVFAPGSEVNKLNVFRKRKVSKELFDLIDKALDASRKTDGEFDITVMPILKAAGFYKDMHVLIRKKIPKTYEGVGWKNILVDKNSGIITLNKATWIDPSGIAKGYIVDRMAKVLRKDGINKFLINAGGDIYCTSRQGDAVWKIGVRDPGKKDVAVLLGLKNTAVATSGDYENVVVDEKTGSVVSHIVEPFESKVLEKTPFSVTVIASTCTEADALATGMMAMGPAGAIALADTMSGVEAIAVIFSGEGSEIMFSENAEKYAEKI